MATLTLAAAPPPAPATAGPRPSARRAGGEPSFVIAGGSALHGRFRRTPRGDLEYEQGPGHRSSRTLTVRFGPADLLMDSASGEVSAVRCTLAAAACRPAPLPALRPAPGRLLMRAPGRVAPHLVCLAHPDATVASWDRRSGWVMVAPLGDERRPADRYVEFASGITAALESGRLAALWLRQPAAA